MFVCIVTVIKVGQVRPTMVWMHISQIQFNTNKASLHNTCKSKTLLRAKTKHSRVLIWRHTQLKINTDSRPNLAKILTPLIKMIQLLQMCSRNLTLLCRERRVIHYIQTIQPLTKNCVINFHFWSRQVLVLKNSENYSVQKAAGKGNYPLSKV